MDIKEVVSNEFKQIEKTLSAKELRFVNAFEDDAVYAMRVAGYHGTDAYLLQEAQKLLADPKISFAVKNLRKQQRSKTYRILDKLGRLELLSCIAMNVDPFERPIIDEYGQEAPPPPPSLKDRLKAMDMINKIEGDYHTNVNINQNVSITDLVLSSFTEVGKPVDIIEAEYKESFTVKKEEPTEGTKSSADELGL